MPNGNCSRPGCTKVGRLIGPDRVCGMHYRRMRVSGEYGEPGERRSTASADERFWAKVVKDDDHTGCWFWVGYRQPRGYGMFGAGPHRLVLAHRWAWEREHGPVPEGLELDHLCRHTSCVNPAHLEAVTHLENVRRGDRVKR